MRTTLYHQVLDLDYFISEIKDKIVDVYLADEHYTNVTAGGICSRLLDDALNKDDRVIYRDYDAYYVDPTYSQKVEDKVNKALMELLIEGQIIYSFDKGYFKLYKETI